MSVVGHQEFWLAGSRFYYQRDPVSSVTQPVIDLGVIEPANPTLNVEKVELKDSDGGLRKTVAESVIDINEVYDIVCSNLNARTLSLLLLGSDPEPFTQTDDEIDLATYAHPGELVKVLANAQGDGLFNIEELVVYETGSITALSVTDIDATAKTITVTEDASSLTDGDEFLVRQQALANKANAGKYTVASTSGSGPTVITVDETPAGNEVSIAGLGALGIYQSGTDYEVVSLDRGLVRLVSGGALSAAGNVQIYAIPNALTGDRLFNPQDVQDSIEGKGWLIFGRGNNARQTVREGRISITPSAANIQVENYSNVTLQVRFLTDLELDSPSGRMLAFKGTLPSAS